MIPISAIPIDWATKDNATDIVDREHNPLHSPTPREKETTMLDRFSGSTITLAIVATAVGVAVSVSVTPTSAQAPAASVTAPAPPLTTPWGEPDLQGIWTDEFDTSMQRPA